jgi:ABC-type glycerol-3-phosphate transport system permease component
MCGAACAIFPFFWMVVSSLKPATDALLFGRVFTTSWRPENYVEAWHAAPFGRYFINSFLVAFLVSAGTIFTSATAAYAFARLRFPGKQIVYGAYMATVMIPFEVSLIPNFVIIKSLGWFNTYPALIVPWLSSAFAIFLLRQFFLSLPSDYYDAAEIDGCGHWQFLWRVAMPIAKPAIVTVGLFAFLGSYNALLWPLIVTKETRMRVIQVGLAAFMSEEVTQFHLLMAASTIAILPTVILYFVAQRQFVEGAVSVGIKG